MGVREAFLVEAAHAPGLRRAGLKLMLLSYAKSRRTVIGGPGNGFRAAKGLSFMQESDYYQVLGLDTTASMADIKAAYRKLAFQYHPDRTRETGQGVDKMKAINEAYAVLSDAEKRRRYDAMRTRFGAGAAGEFRKTHSQEDIFQQTDIHQVFEEMARNFGLRGFDAVFRECYGDHCRTFRVRRPGFFFGGAVFSGAPGGRRGRPAGRGTGRLARMLIARIAGALLPRKGRDLSDTITVSPRQAVQGGPYAYAHRKRGKKLVVNIPPATRNGQRIRLAGMGMPGAGGGPDGDLFLRVRVVRSIGEKLRALIRRA